jgi:hypothetical protein
MTWKYKEKEVLSLTDMPEETYGFIYKISNKITGQYYIGKKQVVSVRKKNFGKKKLSTITDKRVKKYEMVSKESDWKTYRSSNSVVKSWNEDEIELEILRFCKSKKSLTYYELQEQFYYNVLADTNSLNDNLIGKFFRKDLF